MPEPIIFYDIPGNVKGTAWSPNTWRVRFTLNYKHLAYKTVWIEYPDIVHTCKAIGAAPTSAWPDGSPMYTLPAIVDPSTGAALTDSIAIARYLDAQYPETPKVIPDGTEGLHEAFQVAMNAVLMPHLNFIVMPTGRERLNAASKAYYKQARERQWGGSMEEWSPPGSETRARQWGELEMAFRKIARWFEMGGGKDGKGMKFLMGSEPSFADFMVAARLVWLNKILGEESEEWKNVERWDGGRWARLLDALDELLEVRM